jgi:hypothetical protein
MRSSPPLRAALLALLALAASGTLAVSPAAGAALPGSVLSVSATTLGGWDWVSRTWSWLWGVRPEAGCIIDPNGGCVTKAPVRSQDGCGMDPNGRCLGRAHRLRPTDGCGIDPNGHCGGKASRPRPSAGCGIDPNGHCGGLNPIGPTVPKG